MKNMSGKLSGGDLRSIAQANEVVKDLHSQKEFDELFGELYSTDRLVVMRAADAIEKITLGKPAYLAGYKKELLAFLSASGHIEFKWHLAQLITRVKLSPKELRTVWEMLKTWALNKNESRIVRVNAIQAMFELCKLQVELQADFRDMTSAVEKEQIPSINARLRKIRASH